MYRTQRLFLGREILLRTVLALHIVEDQSEGVRERHLDYISDSEDAKKTIRRAQLLLKTRNLTTGKSTGIGITVNDTFVRDLG